MEIQLKTASGDQKFMGSYGQGGVCLGTLNGKWRLGASMWSNESVAATTEKTKITVDATGWKIGEFVVSGSGLTQAKDSLFLCGIRYNGYLLETASIKVYSFEIYENDNLVRSFIPVKRADGAVGLYDIVEGKFYENSGTGSFVAGKVVV